MDKDYERALKLLDREFGKERKLYLATSVDGRPKVRIVSTRFNKNAFIITSDISSDFNASIISDIKMNNIVSLCGAASFHNFSGRAFLSETLDVETNESGQDMIEVRLDWAFTYGGKKVYKVDFESGTCECGDFKPHG